MLFDHHEPLSPGLQAILLAADDEDALGVWLSEDALRRELQQGRNGCFRHQNEE